MKKKISLFLGVLFLDLTAFLISSTCVSLSWFNKGFNVKFDNQTGKSLANYFASGDGTKDNPYTITESIHFYNFAWLQYLGEFNKTIKKDNIDVIDQKYFKLGSNVNMNGLVVPPVGTSEYAFVGNFDGGEYVVNNLTVSNNFDDFSGKHPSVVTKADFDKKNINILGAFGVVGNDEVNNPDKKSKYNLTENGITSPINCLKNLYLDNVTIKSTSNQLLIGIIAGYVNGCIETCGVHYSKLEIANGTQYISGNQIINLNSNINNYINNNISNYALLGAYNNDSYYWDGEPGFGGSGNDFGGSIDIYNLDRRIVNINSRSDTVSDTNFSIYKTYTNAKFNLVDVSNFGKTITEGYNTSNATSINEGSFLPLNVDLSKIDDYGNTTLSSSETILPNNTGYIVGGGSKTATGGAIKIQRIAVDKTSNRLDKFFIGSSTDAIDASNIAFSYWDQKHKKTIRIKDKENYLNFQNDDKDFIKSTDLASSRYDSVKKDILEILKNNSLPNTKFASPLLFFNKTNNSTTSDNIATLKEAYICGSQPKLDYQMYKGGINFTLTKSGAVTFVMPTIRDDKSELFNLYSVQRDSNYKIIGSTELSNKLPSTGKQLLPNRIYYCEVSLEKGDYFLGATSSTAVPYFMYLDIGASGSSTTTDPKKPLKNVDFVDAAGEGENKKLNKVDPNNLSNVAFKISGTFDNNYSYYFRRRGDIVYYSSYCVDVRLFNFIKPSNTGKKEKSDSDCEISVE